MKRTWLAILATVGLFNAPARAQVDLGGTLSGAVNQATGGTQTGANAGANLGTNQSGTGTNLGGSAGANLGGTGTNLGGSAGANLGGAGTNLGGTAGANLSGAGSNLGTQGSIQASGAGSNLPGPNFNATGQAAAGVSGAQTSNQNWLGRVGNDLRNAVRQGSDGAMQLQSDINQSLRQYGFQPGDQLLDASGQPLTQAQFDQYLQQNNGQLRVLRNGQMVVLNGNNTLGSGQFGAQGQVGANGQWNQGQFSQSQQMGGQFYGQGTRPRLGVTMRPSNDGVHIIGVVVGSPAAQAGLKPGDQIIAVNGQDVNNPGEMIEAINSLPNQEQLNIQYVRQGRQMEAQAILASQSAQMSDSYRAGYPNWDDSQQGLGGAGGSLEQRLATLERTVFQLRQQVRELGGQPIDDDFGGLQSTTLQSEIEQSQSQRNQSEQDQPNRSRSNEDQRDDPNQDGQGEPTQSDEPATDSDSSSSDDEQSDSDDEQSDDSQ